MSTPSGSPGPPLDLTTDLRGGYAGFVSRLAGWAIDQVVLVVSFAVFTWMVSRLLEYTTDPAEPPESVGAFLAGLLGFYGMWAFVYTVIGWSLFGKTVGKALMGLRIVDKQGRIPRLPRSILRFACMWLSALAFGLGFAWILVSDTRRAWHDYLARTFVVYDWRARASRIDRTKERLVPRDVHDLQDATRAAPAGPGPAGPASGSATLPAGSAAQTPYGELPPATS